MAFTIKRGDTRPSFVVQLRENYGTSSERPIDLRDAESVSLVIKRGNLVFKRPMTVLYPLADPTDLSQAGYVQFDWVDTDTQQSGTYQAEAEITWAPGAIETVPNDTYWTITVVDDLG